MAKGIYRTKTEASGAEYATVDYGNTARLESIGRDLYEQNGYTPPFDALPTKEEYEAGKNAART